MILRVSRESVSVATDAQIHEARKLFQVALNSPTLWRLRYEVTRALQQVRRGELAPEIYQAYAELYEDSLQAACTHIKVENLYLLTTDEKLQAAFRLTKCPPLLETSS